MSSLGQETKGLSNFETLTASQNFKTATVEPEFFKTHLVDPLRIIKIFKDDPNAVERIFYYQYLKLCTEDQGYPQIRIENMKIILNSPEFYFIFPADCQGEPYTDSQFKRLGIEFLDQLKNYNKKIDSALKKYPIIDLVFCYLMRSLLILNMQAEECQQFIPKEQVLSVLGRIFDIEFQSFDKCTKFTQSDVFVYEESPFQTYMVYLRYQPEPKTTQFQNELRPPIQRNSSKKQRNQLYKSNTSNQHYDFVDYTGLEQHKQLFPKANLFQSENLTIKYSNLGGANNNKSEYNLFQTFNQHGNMPKNGLVGTKIEDLKQIDEDVVMDIDQIMDDLNQAKNKSAVESQNLSQLVPEKQKKPTEIENQLSGFESQEDAPKFTTNFPTTSTFSKLVEPKVEQYKKSLQRAGISQTSLQQNNQPEITKIETTKIEIKPSTDFAAIEIKPYTNFTTQLLRRQQPVTFEKSVPYYAQTIEYERKNPLIQNQIQYTVKKSLPSYIQQFNSKFRAEELSKKYTTNPTIRLNVTKQFTNSFILKEMPEIYQDSIRRSRERARIFRKKILQAI